MATFWRDKYRGDTVSKCVGGTIKVQGPSRSFSRSVIQSVFFNVAQSHDILIGEIEPHGLLIFDSLMIQMVN